VKQDDYCYSVVIGLKSEVESNNRSAGTTDRTVIAARLGHHLDTSLQGFKRG